MMHHPLALVFPPQWDPKQPYLALPALAARLRAEGVPTLQLDANIAFYQRILSAPYLTGEVAERLRTRKKRGLPPADAELEQLPRIAEDVEKACAVFRDPKQFFDLGRFHWAKQVFGAALAVVSAAFSPTRIGFYDLKMRYPFTSSTALADAALDEAENPFIEFFETETLPRLEEAESLVVGISISSFSQMAAGFTLARLVKQRMPGVLVVVGGNTFNRYTQQLERNPVLYRWVDAYLVGEGETPLVRLMESVKNGASLEGVPNLHWRADTGADPGEDPDPGSLRKNERCPPEDMNALPVPDFDGLPLDRYLSPMPVLPVETSRGCLWGKCAFCSHYIVGESYRHRRPEKVLDDLRELRRRHGAVHFNFTDNTMPTRTARRVAKGLVEGGDDLSWMFYARFVPSYDEALCRLLAEAGCRSIWFGLEAASQRVLDSMNKGTKVEVAREVVRRCHEAGVSVDLFCMVGFPSETAEEALETLAFLEEMRHGIVEMNSLFAVEAFSLDSCSRVGLHPEQYGVLPGEGDAGETESGADAGEAYPRDLSPWGPFRVEKGLSPEEAVGLAGFIVRRLAEKIPRLPLEDGDREAHVLLYRSREPFQRMLREMARRYRTADRSAGSA